MVREKILKTQTALLYLVISQTATDLILALKGKKKSEPGKKLGLDTDNKGLIVSKIVYTIQINLIKGVLSDSGER